MEKMYCDHEREHLAAAQRAREGVLASEDVEKMCKIFVLCAITKS